jgi:hypothetical protein
MLMHFTTNAISVTLAFITGTDATMPAAVDYTSVLGTYLILGFMSPVVIILGVMLVNPEGHKKIRFLYAGILAAAMLVSGIAINAFASSKNMILNTTFSYKVTEEGKDCSMIDFDVEEDRNATVVVMLTNAESNYSIRIDGDKGSNIINSEIPKGSIRMIAYDVGLQADHYTVTVVPGEEAIGEQPNIQITIK